MKRLVLLLAALAVVAVCGSVLVVGLLLAHPAQTRIGSPPPELGAETVEFRSSSGATLHGWLAPGRPGGGVVVLMHGVRGNRLAMVRRAQVLKQNGFGVLLFDFQAHGESVGRQITFGYLEGRDAASAVAYARQRMPGERVGALGVSLGGAATLLDDKPLPVDALILESVYPDIGSALTDRIRVHLGKLPGGFIAEVLTPLFEIIMAPIIGVSPAELRPIDRIGEVTAPLLLMSGTNDDHTTIGEARALFERARAPKEFWAVQGAGHVDLEYFATREYWLHVLPFLQMALQRS